MPKIPRSRDNVVRYQPSAAPEIPMQLADMSSWTNALDKGAAFAADRYQRRQLAEQEVSVRDAENKLEELIAKSADNLQYKRTDDPDKPFDSNSFSRDALGMFDEGVADIMNQSSIISSGGLNETNNARLIANINAARSRAGREANAIASKRLVDRLQLDFHSKERIGHQAIIHGDDAQASFNAQQDFYDLQRADNATLGFFTKTIMEQKIGAGIDLAIKATKKNLADRFANDLLGNARGSDFKGQDDFNAWETEVMAGEWDDFIEKGGMESKESFINEVFSAAMTAETTMMATTRRKAKLDFARTLGAWVEKSSDPNAVITPADLEPLFKKLQGGVYMEGNDLISAFNQLQRLVTDPTKATAVQDKLYENMRASIAIKTTAGMDVFTTADIMQSMADGDFGKFADLHYSHKAEIIKYVEERNSPQTKKVDAAIDFVYQEWKRDLSQKTAKDKSLQGSMQQAFGVAGNVLFPELASGRLAPFSIAVIESSVRAYVRDNPDHSAMKAQSEVIRMLTSQIKKGNYSDVTNIDIDDRILEEAIYKKNIPGGVLNYKEEVVLGLFDIKTSRLSDLQERIVGEYSYLKKGDLRDVVMDKFSYPQRISKGTGKLFDASVIKENVDMYKEAASLIEPLHFRLLEASTRAKRRARDFNQSLQSKGGTAPESSEGINPAIPKVSGQVTEAHQKFSPEDINKMIQKRAEDLGLDATQFLVNSTAKPPAKTPVSKKAVTTPKADSESDEYTRRQGENSQALYDYGREWEEASVAKYGSLKSAYTSKEGRAYMDKLKKDHPLKFLTGTALMEAIRKSRKGE